MASDLGLCVAVVYSPTPRQLAEVLVNVSEPCTVLEALQLSGLLRTYPELDHCKLFVGVWGRRAPLDQLLRDLDRIEVYRPLQVDPKVARHERFVKQGSRSAGLFEKKRSGAKAGY